MDISAKFRRFKINRVNINFLIHYLSRDDGSRWVNESNHVKIRPTLTFFFWVNFLITFFNYQKKQEDYFLFIYYCYI